MPVIFLRDQGYAYQVKLRAGAYIVRTGSRGTSRYSQAVDNIPLKYLRAAGALAAEPVRMVQRNGNWEPLKSERPPGYSARLRAARRRYQRR